MARHFYLYPRKTGIYYVEFIDISGTKIWKSTRCKNRDEAAAVVGRWLIEGVPVIKGKTKKPLQAAADFKSAMKFIYDGDIDENQALEIAYALKTRDLLAVGISPSARGKQGFINFLFNFWDYDNSLYLRDKRAHGKDITRRTCIEAKRSIKRNWQPYFGNKSLIEITRNDIRNFGLELRTHLAGKTVNNVIHFGTTALKWAHREKMIPEDITAGIGGFSGGGKKRDILTGAEIEKLKNIKYWDNQKAYVAFMLAITSALRSGEIRALKREDIGENILYVRNGYNSIDGIKAPKNGEERTVYLLPEVRELLINLLHENPCMNEPDKHLIFFGNVDPQRPCGGGFFVKWLKRAIGKAGIDITGRKIDFHSCRHYVITKWADKTGDLRQAARIAGHKDLKQTARYSDHIEEAEIAEMGKRAANILQFRQEGTA
jgi:integrase